MIPVGGGSALPNKAVEAFSSHGPILISPYIFSLRSSFPGLLDRKNIFFYITVPFAFDQYLV